VESFIEMITRKAVGELVDDGVHDTQWVFAPVLEALVAQAGDVPIDAAVPAGGPVAAARPDDGEYDTFTTANLVKFHKGTELLDEVWSSSGFFELNGQQYRDESGALMRLIDSALEAAEVIELGKVEEEWEDDDTK